MIKYCYTSPIIDLIFYKLGTNNSILKEDWKAARLGEELFNEIATNGGNNDITKDIFIAWCNEGVNSENNKFLENDSLYSIVASKKKVGKNLIKFFGGDDNDTEISLENFFNFFESSDVECLDNAKKVECEKAGNIWNGTTKQCIEREDYNNEDGDGFDGFDDFMGGGRRRGRRSRRAKGRRVSRRGSARRARGKRSVKRARGRRGRRVSRRR